MKASSNFVILISANAEWREIKKIYPGHVPGSSPYGEWFEHKLETQPRVKLPVIFFHGGWGKVAAAGSTQYVIDRWNPKLLVNLGTCGGFEGEINRGDIILVEKTIIYDIYEQMGDPAEHIQHYTAEMDRSWLSEPYPTGVIRSLLVSGDRDLFPADIVELKSKYGAVAGDWESGAIAWVAAHNHTQFLILRGVTDLVGLQGGEAYQGKVDYYYENTKIIMEKLIDQLPFWLTKYIIHYGAGLFE